MKYGLLFILLCYGGEGMFCPDTLNPSPECQKTKGSTSGGSNPLPGKRDHMEHILSIQDENNKKEDSDSLLESLEKENRDVHEKMEETIRKQREFEEDIEKFEKKSRSDVKSSNNGRKLVNDEETDERKRKLEKKFFEGMKKTKKVLKDQKEFQEKKRVNCPSNKRGMCGDKRTEEKMSAEQRASEDEGNDEMESSDEQQKTEKVQKKTSAEEDGGELKRSEGDDGESKQGEVRDKESKRSEEGDDGEQDEDEEMKRAEEKERESKAEEEKKREVNCKDLTNLMEKLSCEDEKLKEIQTKFLESQEAATGRK